MPWEISIVASEDQSKPLGSREEVTARFAAALPGAVLQVAASMPPEIIAQMPPILRENALRPRNLGADFEAEDFSIQFYTDNKSVLYWINAEIRGNGNPLPALAALCVPNGWLVVDSRDSSVVDLTAGNSPEWDRFRKWRDKAIDSLKQQPPAIE